MFIIDHMLITRDGDEDEEALLHFIDNATNPAPSPLTRRGKWGKK